MGVILSYFLGYPEDNLVDPATGLTGKEKRLVNETWALLRGNPVSTGVAIMLPFFEKYPEYQQFFTGFKDVPMSELPENKRFQAHCGSIATAISSMIDSLNDFGLLEAKLLILGEKHAKRGQNKLQFENLKGMLPNVLRAALGRKFTPDVEDAWLKTLKAMYIFIFKGMEQTEG